MIVKTLLAALVAGLIAGVFMTAAQQYRVVPLILHAEQFENGHDDHDDGEEHGHEHSAVSPPGFIEGMARLLSPVGPAMAHGDGETLFGLDRFAGTLMANLVTGAGFGLLLAAASLFVGVPVSLANGVLWGAAAWLAVHLLPAVGLPPELPGMPAADLGARQLWWIVAVLFSAAGIYLLVLRAELWAKAGGLALIALPHVFGAPHPADIAGDVPAVLAAEFAVAALATTLAFWIVLSLAFGYLTERFGRAG